MTEDQPNNPLHGVTLETILTELVEKHGWEELGKVIKIRCFTHDPSIKSSLQFLRKTPWAREKVEKLYLGPSSKKSGRRRSGVFTFDPEPAEPRTANGQSEALRQELPE